MVFLRLYLFHDRFVSLTYGLPLLVCLWHKDRRLLWSMAAAFLGMAALKTFVLIPDPNPLDFAEHTQFLFHAINIVVIGTVIHLMVNLTERLKAKNAKLEEINAELSAREEEVSRQNEELQQQSEELSQQNEELRQQEEKLHAQAEELRTMNEELGNRESMLQTILMSLRGTHGEREIVGRVCQSLLQLLGPAASGAAVVERVESEVVLHAHAGLGEGVQDHWPFERSFAAVVIAQNRTAYVDDLSARPDFIVPRPQGRVFRSILAAPLWLNGVPSGAVEVYSTEPRKWTNEEFRILEWVAAQSALVLETLRLKEELQRANTNLESTVRERTAKLQETVAELESFSYTVVHDLRAPLRAMQSYAKLLLDDFGREANKESHAYLKRIVASSNRMDQLITDVLSFSRITRCDQQMRPVVVQELLQGILESYPDFQPPKASITIAGRLPSVYGNEALLTQCLSNLLGNAVKFVAPGTTPKVRIWAEQRAERADGEAPNGRAHAQIQIADTVSLAVDTTIQQQPATNNHFARLWFEDNGIGIEPESHDRIFGVFQRLNPHYEGTGIGLAIVRKAAERMGGRAGVESQAGKGSRFWIELRHVED